MYSDTCSDVGAFGNVYLDSSDTFNNIGVIASTSVCCMNNSIGEVACTSNSAISDCVVSNDNCKAVSDEWIVANDMSLVTNCKYVELHEAVFASGVYNFQGVKIPVESNVNVSFWEHSLIGYDDSIIVNFLKYGWPVNFCSPVLPVSSARNHPTAMNYEAAVDEYIHTELQHNALAGPFSDIPMKNGLVISPLHTVAKKKGDDSVRRVVFDLSFPPGESVNDGIPKCSYLNEDIVLEYPSVDRFVELLVKYHNEGGCWMLKRDLSRAYRQLRVDPRDYNLLGFKWKSHVYFDISLPFGLRTAAQACQRTTNALAYILHQQGVKIVNYVDDIACAAPTELEAREAGQLIDSTVKLAGLELADKKSVEATQIMTFLGIQFNSKTMTMEVTQERLQEIQLELEKWSGKKRATKRDIQSLAGKLQFIAKCCKHGRCFMNRILGALRKLKRSSHFYYLNAGFKRDVLWWQNFLPHFNAVSVIRTGQWAAVDTVIATDACLQGAGGTCGKEYFRFTFPQELKDKVSGINQLEAITVVMALKLWGPSLRGLKFVIRCDNQTTVAVINKGSAHEEFLQACAREIAFLACKYEFEMNAVHIPGVENTLPDWLSRTCIDAKFLHLFRAATDDSWSELQMNSDCWKFSCTW